jgi:2-(1,2-epoxy-1,2-dihydrophenyl)acetyl-CoA isomerase
VEIAIAGERVIDYDEFIADELGIGNEFVEHEALLSSALGWCERLDRLPAHVLAMTKPVLRQCADMTWEQAIALEEFAEPMCFTTEAHAAGVRELHER